MHWPSPTIIIILDFWTPMLPSINDDLERKIYIALHGLFNTETRPSPGLLFQP
jgi:hypothetical protein